MSVEKERSSSVRDVLENVVLLSHLWAVNWKEEWGSQADAMGDLSVLRSEQDYPDVSASSHTDEEIFERISASTNSYTTESNEDTFKLDTVFESFHH